MPNTTNYSFPTPADTDLVKNGADAIRDLGDAVDTAMNTALGTKKAGMVLLNTTSFSGVASQSVNDVFSSTYDNYKICLDVASVSGALVVSMRLRSAGSDNSASKYGVAGIYYVLNTSTSGSGAVGGTNPRTDFYLGSLGASTSVAIDLEVYNPNKAQKTIMLEQCGTFSSNDTYVEGNNFVHQHNVASAFTGFTLLTSTNNMTGTVSVYGYNK